MTLLMRPEVFVKDTGMNKTYALIEIEDGELSDSTVCGSGKVQIITIDWDSVGDDEVEAEETLACVIQAIYDLCAQGLSKEGAIPLGKARDRLKEIINAIIDESADDDDDEEDDDDDDVIITYQ